MMNRLATRAAAVGLVVSATVAFAQPGAPDADVWWRTLLASPTSFVEHRDRVLADWRAHGSYYALLEIVEGRLEPSLGRIHVEQVMDLLGTRRLDLGYPNSRRDNFLVWSSRRLVPQGSYLVVQFDAKGIARSIDWVSE
jgi:hypothetical protein